MILDRVVAEKYPSKVGAAFDTEEEAERTAVELNRKIGVDQTHLEILRPGDPNFEKKLEPETHNIAKTLVQSHLRLGGFGFFVGAVICAILNFLEIAMVIENPFYAYPIILAFSTVLGLLCGGLVSLRPDHDPLINFARKSVQENRYVLLMHLDNQDQKKACKKLLRDHHHAVVSTL